MLCERLTIVGPLAGFLAPPAEARPHPAELLNGKPSAG